MARNKISNSKRRVIYERDNWTCQYCGLVFTPTADGSAPTISLGSFDWVCLEMDHIKPCKYGGTNDIENLRAACSPCNRRKSACTMWVDWADRIRIARELLIAGPDDQQCAESAAAILLGYVTKSEMPRPQFLLLKEAAL